MRKWDLHSRLGQDLYVVGVSPQLDAAAPALAGDVRPVVLAKIDAEKYSSVASQYKIRYVSQLRSTVWLDNLRTFFLSPWMHCDLLVVF